MLIDILIVRAHLFTMQGTGVGYIHDGAVAVEKDRIVSVGTSEELLSRYQTEQLIDASGCVLLPGLVDAHMHTPLAIVRGVAQDVANWMQDALAPYSRYLTPEAALAGCKLNVIEALKAGTTTMVDNTRPIDGWGEFYERIGVRAVLVPGFNALPPGGMAGWKVGDVYPYDLEAGHEAMQRAVDFARGWEGASGGRISVMLGPQAVDMLPLELLHEAKKIAEREGWLLHMHTAQGDRETEQVVKRYGKRPIPLLAEEGFLDGQLLGIHLTDASDQETELAAHSGARMVLCSGSIGIIDGIVPPAKVFKTAGGLVALGSDQASGNNCNNIFNEMKLTALFNKIKYQDPAVMPAWEVLRMGTIEGAQAIGMGDRIGSIEEGKQADMILVDLRAPNLSPVLLEPIRNIVPNLVYAGTGHEVKTVMVAGEVLVKKGEITTMDEESIRSEAQEQAQRLTEQVLQDPVHRKMVLLKAMQDGKL